MSDIQVSPRGIGFAGLLAIVFITLKLCGIINWSWLWVLCPLWIGFAIMALFLACLGIACLVVAASLLFWKK